MHRLLLAALFVLTTVQSGLANPIQNQCLDEKTLRDTLTHEMPRVDMAALAGPEAAFFLAAFNALPPVSQIAADHVLIIGLKNSADVALAFFKDGCMVQRGVMARAAADQLLLQLERNGA